MRKYLPILLLAFPIAIVAKDQSKEPNLEAAKSQALDASQVAPIDHQDPLKKSTDAQSETAKKKGECLASEDVILDLEEREKKLRVQEAQLAEKEKELQSLKRAVDAEIARIDQMKAELQGLQQVKGQKQEEQLNKLIETFENMSPKAAAGVIEKVDDNLAALALSRLSAQKSAKILSNMKPEKSSKLSEQIAYGKKGATE